jgi:hypothetical protein
MRSAETDLRGRRAPEPRDFISRFPMVIGCWSRSHVNPKNLRPVVQVEGRLAELHRAVGDFDLDSLRHNHGSLT